MIEFLKAISDEQRLRILNLLSEKPLCVCEIEKVLKLKQSTLSTHLTKLKRINLLNSVKSGKWVYYSINKEMEYGLYSILQSIINNFSKTDIAKRDIDSLKNFSLSCTDSKKIIIICTKNSCRSQIAEAVFKNFTPHKIFSAGISPGKIVNKNIKAFLKEKFPTVNLFPKHIDNFLEEKFDIAIFICKEAYSTHKDKIMADNIIFWDIEDIDFNNVPFKKINKVYNDIVEHMKKEILK